MTTTVSRAAGIAAACFAFPILAPSPEAFASPPDTGPSADNARIIEHWTPERRAAAIPRDFVVDEQGRAYLRLPNGRLQPYGRPVTDTAAVIPMGKPGGGGDNLPPTVDSWDPDGVTIGTSHLFSARVVDNSGLRSVKFSVKNGTARAQSYAAADADGNTYYTAQVSSLTNGIWTWQVIAKDKAGNTTTTPAVGFTVDSSLGGDVLTNAEWLTPGYLQNAAGRIYFEMPYGSGWGGYVCSGTVVTDGTSGRSIIQTAAHCVYDDVNKVFARNVLFIPNQDETTGSGTDLNCSNDPLGCWATWFGVVDSDWTTRVFPDNIPWDYGYYAVNDTGAHSGNGTVTTLDEAAGGVNLTFAAPGLGLYTRALGYSYSDDPNFMYCAETMATVGTDNWWLGNCDLSGGSSGGPWIQNMLNGTGDVMSVNSWGYTNQPGMAGPKLNGTSAACVFGFAKSGAPAAGDTGGAGLAASCP